MAADFAGTADNCTPIQIGDVSQMAKEADSLSYLRHGEKPYIFLKSKVFEWIFSDLGLTRIERDNAAGVKRTIRRHEWFTNIINTGSVVFTTPGAGITDFSCDLQFQMGNHVFKIDIVKSELEYAKQVYICLNEIAIEQKRNTDCMGIALKQFSTLMAQQDPATLSSLTISMSKELNDKYDPVSFAHVFERCMGGV